MARRISALLLIVLFLVTAYITYPRQFKVNLRAKIDPNKSYTVTLWLSRPNIINLGEFVERVEQDIAQFTALYPHIGVDTLIIPAVLLADKLHAALHNGQPPDLLLDLSGTENYYSSLQIPFSLYLTKDEKAAMPPGVLAQVSQWGLPVAGFPNVLMGNQALLSQQAIDHDRIADEGWSWEQFMGAIAAPANGKYGLVLTNTGAPLARALAVSMGKPAPLTPDLGPSWNEDDLLTLAGLWEAIVSADGVPAQNKLTEDCLGLFLQKKATVIGPVNTFLADWLWREATAKGIAPVILPLPSAVSPALSDMTVHSLLLFRQEPYVGNDHSAASALFGRYVSESVGRVLSEYLGAVPISASGTTDMTLLPFDDISRRIYGDLGRISPVAYESDHWENYVLPHWHSFISGKTTKGQFASAVSESLGRAKGK